MRVHVCQETDDDVINRFISINIELFGTYFALFAFIVIFRQVNYLINTFISINIELYQTYFVLFAFILIFRQVYYLKKFKKSVPTRIRTWVGKSMGRCPATGLSLGCCQYTALVSF